MHDELTELMAELGPDPECHAEAVRNGIIEPCGKPAYGVALDKDAGFYPVCTYHIAHRANHAIPVELGAIISAARDTPSR